MAYVITAPCIGEKDGSCVAVCPVDCIFEATDQYYINPAECIDCNDCLPACPVGAIFPADKVPEPWRDFIAKNKALAGC